MLPSSYLYYYPSSTNVRLPLRSFFSTVQSFERCSRVSHKKTKKKQPIHIPQIVCKSVLLGSVNRVTDTNTTVRKNFDHAVLY